MYAENVSNVKLRNYLDLKCLYVQQICYFIPSNLSIIIVMGSNGFKLIAGVKCNLATSSNISVLLIMYEQHHMITCLVFA